MASKPVDPLQTLQAALSAAANSKEQADLLATLRESLESYPAPIPILVKTLLGVVANAGDSLLKKWVIDLLHFSICRSTLPLEQRTQMSSQSLDTLAQLLEDANPAIVKIVVQCMTTVYPLLFRQLCTNRSTPAPWTTLSNCKTRIIDLVWGPNVNLGVRVSAMKFLQRVILVQTRGISDPRLQNKNDPNISFCPVDHPFISVGKLESEGQKLMESIITMLYTSRDTDLLSAMLSSWASLVKQRPMKVPAVVTALKQWTPAALTGLSAANIKSVEKAVRILLVHISRTTPTNQYTAQITEALSQQGYRMDRAAAEEKRRKADAIAAAAESQKQPSITPSDQPPDAKKPKLESDVAISPSFLSAFDFTSLPAPLITDLIVANLGAFTEQMLITLVQAYRQSRGLGAQTVQPTTNVEPPRFAPTPLQSSTQSIPAPTAAFSHALPPTIPTGPRRSTPLGVPDRATPPSSQPPATKVKDEPVDPLQMDIDQDELEYEPERLNEALSGSATGVDGETFPGPESGATDLHLIDFKLPPPRELTEAERMALIGGSFTRIWTGTEGLQSLSDVPADSALPGGNSAPQLWILLLVRMVTRIAEPISETPDGDDAMDSSVGRIHDFYARQDQLRQTLCEYIMTDFPSRIRLATTWMNEEWYNDQVRLSTDRNWRANYEFWLNQIVASYQALLDLDGKDKTFSRFLLDLPTIPPDVLALLRDLCVDHESPDRMQVGFTTLRGLVIQRPSLRSEALNILLELTTHPEKKTRGAAINSVKPWVFNNSQPMDGMVKEFAQQMLRKLQLFPSQDKVLPQKDVVMNGDDDHGISVGDVDQRALPVAETDSVNGTQRDDKMEDGQLPVEDLVYTPYLPERIELPAQKSQVLQHVELLFVLSVKVPEFLDEIFSAYGQMDETVQDAIQELITALIRSLGPSHGKLLTLMRTCPPGAESLALRVLTIFTDQGKASTQLVAIVKALINERDLDARFLVPVISEMDKPDILRHLPRIVSILNGQPEPKNTVKSVFTSIIASPQQGASTTSSNASRLPPAELMVLLHKSEKEIGLKSTMEAIGICFSMTDIFRSEVLAVVMQQIMDEAVLPVLFLRTVIQAVSTYKSLIGFVSTTLLSRLITKKIWTNPPLWEGFIRCAKSIAPASFGALLQLPKDQLRELVDKQPSLKSGLRDYVTKKATNKARIAGFLDIFGESPEDDVLTTPIPEVDALPV